jgi:methylated-DNA-[protein]-cysteine S-methyltransferase
MSEIRRRSVKTQFGTLCLVEEAGALIRLDWGISNANDPSDVLDTAEAQMLAYDRGDLECFDLPMNVKGSAFQRDVCDAMSAIPFGYTRTYGEIARDLGVPAQAVGQACGGNPIAVIIPCHRVMGAKGLTGFSGAGGVETKVALLRHEGAAGLLI